ncbi:MAG: tetratricopeptide repeat protein [Vitreimonas sp.]
MQRKLTAILSADVVGYSGLMEADEAGTLQKLKVNRSDIFDPQVAANGGRQFKLMGDGALVEFSSVVAAVNAALTIQAETEAAKTGIRYRIGINLGEVIVEGDDIYGEGVNIAARLQALAAPGGVAVSRMVRDNAEGKIECAFEDLGEHNVKNIDRPLHVFAVRIGGERESTRVEDRSKLSVCVLPFANMSGEAEQEYFSDGISEDIITDLSKVSALGVIARNTAFQFKGRSVDVPQVARQLKVSHVLEGSVRKAGGRVRITAQLIDGASGEHVWADRYDRDLNDIFALQDEISQAIVGALKLKLLPEEKRAIEQRGTSSVEAYELFLLARQFQRTGSERMKPLILRLCQRAVALDPNFAQSWALMAAAEAEGFQRQVPGFSFESAKASAERAVALAPHLAESNAAFGEVLLRAGLDTVGSQDAIEIALRLDPNCFEAQLFGGYVYMAQKRLQESIKHFEAAIALDPNAYQASGMVLQAYVAVGDETQAKMAAQRSLTLCEAMLKVEPDHGGALGFIVSALVHLGEAERAREWAKRALLFDPDNLRMHYNVACGMATLRDTETAIALLTELLPKVHGGWISWMRTDTDLDPIRDDPRFGELLDAAEARVTAEVKGGAP